MPPARRVRLTPCDALYLAEHRRLVRRRRGGNIAWMILDADGHAEPDAVREALARVLRAHPSVMGRLRFALLSGRPYWLAPIASESAARDAAERAHTFDDLRNAPDWSKKLEGLCQDRFVPEWDLETGPLVGLEQYALPGDRTRFCLRWPHAFMDAEGAQRLLRELDRFSGAADDAPRATAPDSEHAARDVLAGHSVLDRLRLFRRGFALHDRVGEARIATFVDDSRRTLDQYRYLHRAWNTEQTRRIESNARRLAPDGTGRHARFLAACVIRALHQLYLEHDIATDGYTISFPLSVSAHDTSEPSTVRRPLPGNYLVSPVLFAARGIADSFERLGATIQEQLDAYHQRQGPVAQWAQMWLASRLRARHLEWVMDRVNPLGTLCSGFSYYREIADPVRRIAGAAVTNCAGGGPSPTPPGWNPTFSRYRDKLNLTLSYSKPAVDDDIARRFVELIEAEALD